jgi:hypothetical protein
MVIIFVQGVFQYEDDLSRKESPKLIRLLLVSNAPSHPEIPLERPGVALPA